jgi:hypothetical protein
MYLLEERCTLDAADVNANVNADAPIIGASLLPE